VSRRTLKKPGDSGERAQQTEAKGEKKGAGRFPEDLTTISLTRLLSGIQGETLDSARVKDQNLSFLEGNRREKGKKPGQLAGEKSAKFQVRDSGQS